MLLLLLQGIYDGCITTHNVKVIGYIGLGWLQVWLAIMNMLGLALGYIFFLIPIQRYCELSGQSLPSDVYIAQCF